MGGFKLCCWAEAPFTLSALAPRADWKHTSATAEWAHLSAGGCPNPENSGWHSNPQSVSYTHLTLPTICSV